MIDLKKIIKSQNNRLKIANNLFFLPDVLYLRILYLVKTGKKLNINHPVGFTEKLNWLKIHYKNKIYSDYVDKILAKKIVDSKIGTGHTIPTLGAWDSFSKIDFSKLPEEFVLKCNHDSGSVKIINNKSDIDKESLKIFFDERLKINSANIAREYPYRNVKPQIMAEPIIGELSTDSVNDYKFFCFYGEPKIMYIATERSSDCKFDWFDMNFNHLDIVNIHPNSCKKIEKPDTFDEMKTISKILSEDFPFVRIDLYEIAGKVYFGEYTFFHAGGLWPLSDKWENILGEYLNIEILNKR